MNNFKKGALVLLSLPLVGLTGCSSSSSDTITLTVWEDESNISMLQTLADEFVASYKKAYPLAPSIEIEFNEQSEKSAIEKLSTVASTGNGGDVIAITHDTIASAVKSGLIDEAFYSDELVNRMSVEAIKAASYNGKVYGYPITAESMTVMYNKKLLSSSDLTSFDALKASGKTIALDMQVDGGYYTFGFNSDAVLFGEDGKTASSVKIGGDQAIANWTSFINNYTGTVVSMTPETSISQLSTSTIAGVISSPFLYSDVIDALGKDNVGLAVLPSISGTAERPFSGYKCYAVNKYSKNPALAHMLADFLTSDDAQTWRLHEKSYLPCAKTYTDDMNDIIANNANMAVFKESLDHSLTMPNIEQMANFWKPMNNAVSALWNLKGTSVTSDQVKSILDEVTSAILK